ncbi:hypothetical protein BDY24DRAFT_162803 [Mrakia frigida]|uniref:C2H2-type zinc finger protein n=1 Tax=Mrakia frigida TaxID=29902 RepID=UPI003FCC0C39
MDDEEEAEDGEATVFDTPIPIPLNKIASSPLYPDPSNPAHQACILCPDKVLKNQQMTDSHMTSKSHKRALARFVAHLQKGDPGSEDGRVIVEEINTLLEKETKKLERMKEMYAAEIKGKSLENRTNAKAKRLAKRALKAAAADPNSTATPSTSIQKPKQKKSEQPSNPGEPSKTQQRKAARREESIQKKRAAREAARIANGGKDEGSVVDSETSELVPSKPIKRSKLAAAKAESSPANRRGGGGARAKAAKKSKGGGMTEEEAAKRTAEGRAKKAAATKPADRGWGARKAAAVSERKEGGGEKREGGGARKERGGSGAGGKKVERA